MNMTESGIQVASLSGAKVSNYRFRRTDKRLFCHNNDLNIQSYRLNKVSSPDYRVKMLEVLNFLRSEAPKSSSTLMGLWFASYWQVDTKVNQKIGSLRIFKERKLQVLHFDDSGVIEKGGEILHWGLMEINNENFIPFTEAVSFYDNGFLLFCDEKNCVGFREMLFEEIRQSAHNSRSPRSHSFLYHYGFVDFAISQKVKIVTVTHWIN